MAAPPWRAGRRTAALAVACGLLPLTACGGVSLSDDSASTFTTMGYGMGDALATVRIDDAQKVLGDLKIRVNEGAFDEQQFLSAVAAGEPPDVVLMDRTLIGGYASRGAVVPLTDCLKDERIDVGQYRESAIEEATLDGTVYGVPDSYDSRVLLMDGAALKEAGHSPSDVDTSDWDGLRRLTEDLKKTDGGKLSRIGFDPKIPEFFPLWVRANGGELLSPDGRTARLDSPEAIEALEYTVGLINAQGGWGKFKALRDSFDMFGEQNQFARGQLGIFPMEDWYVNVLAGVSPDMDLHSADFEDREGRPLNYVSGYAWAIPKGSAHPDEACTFIKTMTSVETWVHAARAKAKDVRETGSPYVGDFTSNREADEIIERDVWKPTGNAAYDEATRLLYDVQNDGFAVPANAAGSEFEKAWQNAINRVLSGDQTPEEALRQAQEQAQSALDIANQGKR